MALCIPVSPAIYPSGYGSTKKGISKGFCTKYNLTKLVYFELLEDMYQAISREKQIKAGPRKAKMKLIESINPIWRDLYQDILH